MISILTKIVFMLSVFTHGFRLSRVASRLPHRLFCEPAAAATTPAAPSTASGVNNGDLSCLEIRIGKILEIGVHPEAENLYVEKVDIGTFFTYYYVSLLYLIITLCTVNIVIGEATGPRTIVSGLVKYCTAESLLNRNVIVLCNLKPRALKGITSAGMLLCASNADHTQVEPLNPPATATVGELISFEGNIIKPVEAGNKASKSFAKIADDFYVNGAGVATFRGIPFMTTQGPVTASLKGKIS